MAWEDEKDYLASNKDRMVFMSALISGIVSQQKNTLVLVDRIVTGEMLEDMLKKQGIDAIFLQGNVKSTKRFEEYKKFANEDNKCVIAIDKIASTGLNIPRLFNIVFIDYGKAFTKTIQSIGRGLRRASDKDFVTIYDISSTTRYSKKHFNDRIHFYEDAQYPYQIMNIDKWK
jgi:superfamily II DNA or RNA helicase